MKVASAVGTVNEDQVASTLTACAAMSNA